MPYRRRKNNHPRCIFGPSARGLQVALQLDDNAYSAVLHSSSTVYLYPLGQDDTSPCPASPLCFFDFSSPALYKNKVYYTSPEGGRETPLSYAIIRIQKFHTQALKGIEIHDKRTKNVRKRRNRKKSPTATGMRKKQRVFQIIFLGIQKPKRTCL